jgi:hypothetical protein
MYLIIKDESIREKLLLKSESEVGKLKFIIMSIFAIGPN